MPVNDLTWRKSTYSDGQGGNCVEVATWPEGTDSSGSGGECVEVAAWRKSTHSDGSGGNCVEVVATGTVLVRDTTDRDGFALAMPAAAWSAFMATLRES